MYLFCTKFYLHSYVSTYIPVTVSVETGKALIILTYVNYLFSFFDDPSSTVHVIQLLMRYDTVIMNHELAKSQKSKPGGKYGEYLVRKKQGSTKEKAKILGIPKSRECMNK